MILLCCGQTTCKACLQGPACGLCGKDNREARVNEHVRLFLRHYWETHPYQIFCSQHTGEAVTLYCERDKAFICDECFKQGHAAHHSEFKAFEPKRLRDFVETTAPRLRDLANRATRLVEEGEKVVAGESRVNGADVAKLVGQIRELAEVEASLSLRDEPQNQVEEQKEAMVRP